jgi:uncharacterized membrane protein
LRSRLIIFGIILISAGLRVYKIEQKNLWFDEIYSWKISQGDIVQIVSETSGDIHPPLYYILLKFWTNIFSDSIFGMRMLSVLFGILSIYFVYKISKLFLDNNLQIYFVLLIYAFSPLNIYYSQEVRMFNLNLLLCLGSVYFFFKFIYSGKDMSAVFYLLFTILAIYTHYFAFLILFTQLLLIIIFYYKKIISISIFKKYIFYFIIVNLLYAPWYPVFFNQVSKGQPWRSAQSFSRVGKNVVDYFREIFMSSYFSFESNAVYYFSNFLILFILALMIFSIFKILNSKTFFTDRKNSIIYFFLIPLIISIIISFNNSIVLSRYLSITVPYLIIALIYFSFKIYKVKAAVIICSFLLFANCYGSYIYFNNNFKNNDYRRIISYVENNYHRGDAVIVEPHFMGWSFNYYITHSHSKLEAPKNFGWDLNMQLDSLSKETNISSVWFIIDYSSLLKYNYDSLPVYMKQLGFDKINSKSFYLIPDKVKVEYYKKL